MRRDSEIINNYVISKSYRRKNKYSKLALIVGCSILAGMLTIGLSKGCDYIASDNFSCIPYIENMVNYIDEN